MLNGLAAGLVLAEWWQYKYFNRTFSKIPQEFNFLNRGSLGFKNFEPLNNELIYGI